MDPDVLEPVEQPMDIADLGKGSIQVPKIPYRYTVNPNFLINDSVSLKAVTTNCFDLTVLNSFLSNTIEHSKFLMATIQEEPNAKDQADLDFSRKVEAALYARIKVLNQLPSKTSDPIPAHLPLTKSLSAEPGSSTNATNQQEQDRKQKNFQDESGYKHPKKVCSSPQRSQQNPIPVQNFFTPLQPQQSEENAGLSTEEPTSVQPEENRTASAFKKLPPPIFVTNCGNSIQLLKDLEEYAGVKPQARVLSKQNPVSKIYEKTFRIQAPHPDAYRSFTESLTLMKAQWFTYSDPSQRPIKIILKGIPEFVTADEVAADLQKQKFEIINVTQFRRYASKEPLPVFAVMVPRSVNGKRIFHIQEVMYFRVFVEDFVKKPSIPQCYNCQGFWHSSHGCNRSPVCFKCSGPHSGNKCSKSKEIPGKCGNCAGEHIATFRGCPCYPKSPSENPTIPNWKKRQEMYQHNIGDFPSLQKLAPIPTTNCWADRSAAAEAAKSQNPQFAPNPATETSFSSQLSSISDSFHGIKDILAIFTNPAIRGALNLLREALPSLKAETDPFGKLTVLLSVFEKAVALFD